MKRVLADTTAMILFSTLLGLFVEIVLTGLEPLQSFKIRVAAIPLMLVTGRAYGAYRDLMFERFGNGPSAPLKSLLIDSIANVSFQVPLYLGLLAWAGASIGQMLVAATSILLIAGISGRPYGIFLNFWRRLFRVPDVP